MKRNWKTYGLIITVFCVSSSAAIFLPIPELSKNVMASPAAVALIAALYQILRDESTFIKEQRLKEEERLHALSISSHMAVVAFNKHAEFSEKYLEVIGKGLTELSAKGPCKEALDLAEKLKETRLDYAAWVTKDTRESLLPFEQALRMIGVSGGLSVDMPAGDDRKAMVTAAFDLYKQVMEFEKGTQEKAIGVSKVVERIQDLLGINELTQLRKQVIRGANKALEATV
jgi:hypothetical protein